MLIYIEKEQLNNEITQNILSKYGESEILVIDNYKNIFDKNIYWETEKSIIVAWIKNALLQAPFWYWHKWKWFFIKNSLNCVYDCSYCFLKWAFKNEFLTFFVNYKHIKNEILNEISKNPDKSYWFYSSDYSDNLATDNLTNFTNEFIPFFDKLENAKMEIRTKSSNIWNLLKLKPSKNTEIAFSLNPKEIIESYENLTTDLDKRIESINKLIETWWQVGIRFMPLLEVENYQKIYRDFLEYVIKRIDFSKIYSVFIWWLMYTYNDYNKILQKQPYLDILYTLQKNKDWFYKENFFVREWFYNLFWELLWNKCNICLD